MCDELVRIRVNDLGEFIRFRSCGRRFRLAMNNREEARSLPFAERLFNALDPVLQEVGRRAEDDWEESLRDNNYRHLTPNGGDGVIPWAEFAQAVSRLQPGENAFAREVQITGSEGAFSISGRMDFVLVQWDNGNCRLRIVEGKASRKDRTYQRLQLAAYLLLVGSELRRNPIHSAIEEIGAEALEGVVVRIDENTNEPQEVLALQPLNLDTELEDVRRLLAVDGTLNLLANTPTDDVEYQLDSKCDSCVFSVHCFPESARQRRIELTGISPGVTRILCDAGIATIDALADLDLASAQASDLRQVEGLDIDLAQLVALATARRATLPGTEGDPDDYPVQSLPYSGSGQLPPHDLGGTPLVRVYLQVDYDYTQNRLGALSAHITTSDYQVHTPFERIVDEQGRERNGPSSAIRERVRMNPGAVPAIYDERDWADISGRDVVCFKAAPWSGQFEEDARAEEELLESFFRQIIIAINEVAVAPRSPLHFYVYARSEMTQLVEACARTNSRLLSSLRELLGCRDGLEQLLFSCLQDEVADRYATGWTGNGLSVVTSLPWFGSRYHWTRRVGREVVQLDNVFEQDVFDFKSTLAVNPDGTWANEGEGAATRFEIRARFHDSLPAPYWRAAWGTLPPSDDPGIEDQKVRSALRRYMRAAPAGYLEAYLRARTHALRWLEERVTFKNQELAKPAIDVRDLRQFDLGVEDAGRAAIDFLQLDHHVRRRDWIANGLRPVATRVYAGTTIPIRNVRPTGPDTVSGELDLDAFGVLPIDFAARCDLGEGSYCRVTPRSENPVHGQTLGQLTRIGFTAAISSIDWETGRIDFSLRPMFQPNGYVMRSSQPEQAWTHASVDESISDFVANRVEARLRNVANSHAMRWFDPTRPQVPPAPPIANDSLPAMELLLREWEAPHANGQSPLADDQRASVLDGLRTRVQLLKGPPGTGKTATTAASILARSTVMLPAGGIVLVAANTHLAVDTLLNRISLYRRSFAAAAQHRGLAIPNLTLGRVDPNDGVDLANDISTVNSGACAAFVRNATRDGCLVLGGTTTGILKLANKLQQSAQYRDGFSANVLVVDEASMMVFPHFLSLATLLNPAGQIMLAGDNRQLAPIVAHDWETEDRPPVQLYQPFRSAYDAVQMIAEEAGLATTSVAQSALTFTFRLPEAIRQLIALVYDRDGITLQGQPPIAVPNVRALAGDWSDAWFGSELVLIVHNERLSRKQNQVEANIIEQLLRSQPDPQGDSVAIVTPHKAQRHLLRTQLQQDFGAVASVIDTVERLQGGERPNIIVSGTRSDPHAIGAAASFILNLNRANVAFSRTQARLIVVCSRTLLDHVPPEIEDYETAMLWKSLRTLCSRSIFDTVVDGAVVNIMVAAE